MNLNLRLNVVTSVAVFVANFLSVGVTYRLLVQVGGVESIGVWSSLIAWIFIIRIGDVGMTNGIIRFAAAYDVNQDASRIRGYVDTGIVFNAVLFGFLALLGWVAMDSNLAHILPEGSRYTSSVRPVLPILFVVFYLQNLSGLALGALQAIHRGYVGSLIFLVATFVQLFIAVLLVPTMGFTGLAIAQVGQYALMLITGWQFYRCALARTSGQHVPLLPQLASFSIIREIMSFGLKVQLVSFVNGLFEPLAKLLIGHAAGLQVLGLFEMAYKIVMLPRNALVAGVLAVAPAKTRLFSSDPRAFRELHRKSNKLIVLAATAVLVVITLASPLITTLWLGYQEPKLPHLIGILAMGVWISAVSSPSYNLGMATGAMRTNTEAAFIALGLLVLLMLPASLSGLDWPLILTVAVAIGASSAWVLWRTSYALWPTGVLGASAR